MIILDASVSITPTDDTGTNPLPPQLFVLLDVFTSLKFSWLIATVSDQETPSNDNDKPSIAAISTSKLETLTVFIPTNHAYEPAIKIDAIIVHIKNRRLVFLICMLCFFFMFSPLSKSLYVLKQNSSKF